MAQPLIHTKSQLDETGEGIAHLVGQIIDKGLELVKTIETQSGPAGLLTRVCLKDQNDAAKVMDIANIHEHAVFCP